ncbi:MAG: hypothetical protein Q7J25_02965, partial [Vicinamibacterales bacterium]|nr:hypothetical protein [Vicinamibacterales bacterium]
MTRSASRARLKLASMMRNIALSGISNRGFQDSAPDLAMRSGQSMDPISAIQSRQGRKKIDQGDQPWEKDDTHSSSPSPR